MVHRDESVLASKQGERTVLLDYLRGEYYGLNAVATSVWELLCDDRSLTEIVCTVTQLYEVSAEAASRDVVQLLAHLLDCGIVQARERAE